MTFRIFVFSDSHRYVRSMYAAMEDGKPDLVLHLGDMLRDAEELSYAYPQQSIVMVPGNCDGWTTQPLQKLLDIQGKKLLLSHGHIWPLPGSRARTWCCSATPTGRTASRSRTGCGC